MAVLRLPFSISGNGFFDRSKNNDEFLLTRLRIFVLSGSGKYLVLPSPGISLLWQQLITIGPTSKLRSKNILPENDRQKLEYSIRNEANIWLKESDNVINKVEIIGDDNTQNGIKFLTKEFEFIFSFIFAMPGEMMHKNSIGNWNIMEKINVIY
jgi:hypothetical protein